MSLSLNSWNQYLTMVTTDNPEVSHSWICKINENEIRTIKVLTNDEYQRCIEKNSYWNNTCRKLSLKEIMTISQNFLDEMTQTYQTYDNSFKLNPRIDANATIYNLINLTDIFSTEVETKIKTTLENLQASCEPLQTLANALQKISEKASTKRSVEKTKNMWGLIKWYIWSCFFDYSAEIKEIQLAIPKMSEVCESAKESIQIRILINMEGFEEENKIENPDRSEEREAEIFKQFDSPNQVKKLWLTKYAEDKYFSDTMTEKAKTYRTRVIGMLKIWELLNNFKLNSTMPDTHSVTESDLLLIQE